MNVELMERNRSVYLALESIGPISTSMVTIFGIEDPCSRHPFLRFRFTGLPKNSPVYENIWQALAALQGQLEWIFLTREDAGNYIIAPVLLENFAKEQNLPSLAESIKKLGKQEFEKRIQLAIEDIPGVAECLRKCKAGN
jgi:hypothetical protein